jgi:hypothetical protein
MHILWCPIRFTRDDGSLYSIHHFYIDINMPGYEHTFHGGIEYPDGTRTPFVDMKPELIYDRVNRRLEGGKVHFTQEDGAVRTLLIEVLPDTGFHLGAGLYFGYKGHRHGSWRGQLHVDGDYIPNCAAPETARELHQLRDCIVRVDDGGTTGYGIYQTIINGGWPEYDLSEEDSFY